MEGNADYTAADLSTDDRGCYSFTCLEKGSAIGSFTLKVPGIHNVANALAAIALGRKLGLDADVIRRGLLSFAGTDRRFEYKGSVCGASVFDDYAHHPTEITATLRAAQGMPHKKLWVAFQPHTYSRTKALLPEFADALTLADHVIVAEIYAARETDTLGISSADLMQEIRSKGTEAETFATFDEIEAYLKSHLEEGDMLITMGAGNIVEVGEHMLRG